MHKKEEKEEDLLPVSLVSNHILFRRAVITQTLGCQGGMTTQHSCGDLFVVIPNADQFHADDSYFFGGCGSLRCSP
jgi:hypothetical protein